jgi:ketosteroid isomerase-like protein
MCFLLAVALLFQQPANSIPIDADVAAVSHQLSTFAQRMHDKQEDAILGSFTPDAVFIDPSDRGFSTPAQRRKLYDQVLATYDSDLHFDEPTIVMHGHSFHTSGKFTEKLRNRQTGAVQQISGTYQFRLATFYDGHWAFTRMEWVMAR